MANPSANISFIFCSVIGDNADEISLVLPYLPLDITFALIIPSISSSPIMSDTLLWVNGLNPIFIHMS